MKITIESTTQVVELAAGRYGESIQARVWEGETEKGIKVQVLIPRIAAKKDQDCSQLEAELVEHVPPSSDALECFPLRMIL